MHDPVTKNAHIPMSINQPGILFVVATPIGNLKDITLRALEILKTVDLIAAEDTRHTSRLLNHYQIVTPLISCHEHNEHDKKHQIIHLLQEGKSIALVSDAGTPTISDPGFRLIACAVENNITISPIPGVCSPIAALSASGLPTDSFLFKGFLSKKKKKREEQLHEMKPLPNTLIIFESPNRILQLLIDMIQIIGDRQAVLARELTKIHEELIHGCLSTIVSLLKTRLKIKGECILIVKGNHNNPELSISDAMHELKEYLCDTSMKRSDVAKMIAQKYNMPRSIVYKNSLILFSDDPTLNQNE